jgi:predicted nucleotidyltransferase component of viral defense system
MLTADEKATARTLMRKTWDAANVTRDALTKAADPFGVNPREAYASLLHLDTLDALRDLDFLVFKGGTCVQTYLPPAFQRISVDLDFNSRYPHPNTVENAITELNARLHAAGRAATIHGLEYGSLIPQGHDEHAGTVAFARYLPTPFDETAILAGTEFQARLIRVQINVKHHELPALDPTKRKVAFFTQATLQPRHEVKVECASAADLQADKILTITKSVGGFGRERIKDFYDLFALSRTKIPQDRVREKLDRVAKLANATRQDILKGAIERAEDMRAQHAPAKGFVTSTCRDGKVLLEKWETEIDALQERLRALL